MKTCIKTVKVQLIIFLLQLKPKNKITQYFNCVWYCIGIVLYLIVLHIQLMLTKYLPFLPITKMQIKPFLMNAVYY